MQSDDCLIPYWSSWESTIKLLSKNLRCYQSQKIMSTICTTAKKANAIHVIIMHISKLSQLACFQCVHQRMFQKEKYIEHEVLLKHWNFAIPTTRCYNIGNHGVKGNINACLPKSLYLSQKLWCSVVIEIYTPIWRPGCELPTITAKIALDRKAPYSMPLVSFIFV